MSKNKTLLLSFCALSVLGFSCPAHADAVAQQNLSPTQAQDATGTMNASPSFSADGATQPNSPSVSAQQKAPEESSPYKLKLQYSGEEWDNTSGGRETGNVYMNNVDTQLDVNTSKAFGWTGGHAFFEGFYESSRSVSKQLTNGSDSPSPIDSYGYEMFRFYQAYYDQTLGNTNILFGLWDPQSEFANTQTQNVFLNRNFSWNGVIDNSASSLNYAGNYPWTAPVLRVRQKIDDQWTVLGAVGDGMADNPKHLGVNDILIHSDYGASFKGEVDYTPIARTKLYAGYFAYTGRQAAINQTNADGSQHYIYGSDGGYIGGETRLYTYEGRRGLDAFANISVADPTANELNRSANTGLTYTGLLAARPNDKIGFAFAANGFGDPYRKYAESLGSSVVDYEKFYELTYHAPINRWLRVQPDVQYMYEPTNVYGSPSEKDSLVFGIHFEIGRWFDL
jgi:porin